MRVRRQVGDLDLDITLSVEAREVVAVLGPNGAGKTTLLRAIADEQPAVGVVFQDLRLFPHLTALENVAFGPRAAGRRRREADEVARRWLDELGVADLADRQPSQLSGGQAQRVAIARALAIEPPLVLLDEPLSALDAGARPAVRRDLKRALDRFDGASIVVTHDPVDAAVLADRVVVVEAGRVVQEGTLDDVTARPRSRYVADLVGVNLLRGADVSVPGEVDADDFAVVHPRAVALHRRAPEGSPRNVWHGQVAAVDHEGDRARVVVDGTVPLVAEVTAAAVADLGLAPGVEVWASVKATEIAVHPA